MNRTWIAVAAAVALVSGGLESALAETAQPVQMAQDQSGGATSGGATSGGATSRLNSERADRAGNGK